MGVRTPTKRYVYKFIYCYDGKKVLLSWPFLVYEVFQTVLMRLDEVRWVIVKQSY